MWEQRFCYRCEKEIREGQEYGEAVLTGFPWRRTLMFFHRECPND